MEKVYGYCRISTATQKIERQIKNIKKIYPDAIIFSEAFTGTKVYGRKKFNNLIARAKLEASKGNNVKIVFDSVSRMSRNADEGIKLYFDLYDAGVCLEFIKEPLINTEVYKHNIDKQINLMVSSGNGAAEVFLNSLITSLNELFINLAKEQIRLAFAQAEKEVNDLRESTKEGLRVRKELYGIVPGPKKGAVYHIKKKEDCKQKIKKHSKAFGGSLSDVDCMQLVGLSRNTYYKYKKEICQELELEQEN